jgi:acetylornithine deacetylase
MATAGGVLTKEYSIPTIGYGPGNEDVIHAPNEFVEVDKISEAVYGTASIVHSLIGVPVFGWTSDSI